MLGDAGEHVGEPGQRIDSSVWRKPVTLTPHRIGAALRAL
jgi:hypothetical protein